MKPRNKAEKAVIALGEKPTELIELDVNKLTVIQCYGPENKITKYNKKILSVLNKNLKIFKNHER